MTGKISVELTTTLNCVDADKTVIWSLCRHRECGSIQYCHEPMPGNIFKLTDVDSFRSNQKHCDIQQEAEHGMPSRWLFSVSQNESGKTDRTRVSIIYSCSSNSPEEVAVVRTQHYLDDLTVICVPESLSVDWSIKLCLIAAHCNQNDPQPLSILIARVIVYWLMSFQWLFVTGGFENRFSHDANQIRSRKQKAML